MLSPSLKSQPPFNFRDTVTAGLGAAQSLKRAGGRRDPNQQRYPGQSIYIVDIDRYVYLIPFVLGENGNRFLKTIIPSRKATRDYLEGEQ